MWENETIVLMTSLKKRILGENGRVGFEKIANDQAIPTYIKELFRRRIEGLIDKESPVSFQSTLHFDIQSHDIQKLKSRFSDIFQEIASFQEKEVEDILREVLILRLNYILKPFDTIGKRLFEKKELIGFTEMKLLLDPFKEILPYAQQVLDEWSRHEKNPINKESYKKLINELIYPAVKKDSVEVVIRDFNVLTEFLSESKGEEIARIEGTEIQEFLDDRDLWDFREALGVEIKLGKQEFNAVELEMTLKRYLELKNKFGKMVIEYDQEDEKTDTVYTEKKESVKPESLTKEDKFIKGEDWDLDKVMEEETFPINEEKQKVVEEKPKTMRIIRREPKKEIEEELGEREIKSDLGDEGVQIKIKDLRNYIDKKTEATFIKKLFNGDEKEYEKLLAKLEEAESWRVAKILIDNELFKRDIDPFSREAIKLVDIVYGVYYPEEGVGGK